MVLIPQVVAWRTCGELYAGSCEILVEEPVQGLERPIAARDGPVVASMMRAALRDQ